MWSNDDSGTTAGSVHERVSQRYLELGYSVRAASRAIGVSRTQLRTGGVVMISGSRGRRGPAARERCLLERIV